MFKKFFLVLSVILFMVLYLLLQWLSNLSSFWLLIVSLSIAITSTYIFLSTVIGVFTLLFDFNEEDDDMPDINQ